MNTLPHLKTRDRRVRYHATDASNLFEPIAFSFVTARMCEEILAERQQILSLTPPSRRHAQNRLFDKYDPKRSADIFRSLLRPFIDEGRDAHIVRASRDARPTHSPTPER